MGQGKAWLVAYLGPTGWKTIHQNAKSIQFFCQKIHICTNRQF
jgi:hypothetical protein